MRPPRLRCALFPLIYPPHLLVLPATFRLHLLLQTYLHFRALYVISVRRTKSLLTASFRFHLTMDTLAVRLYTSSLPRRVWDFHPLERAHGAQTKRSLRRMAEASSQRYLYDTLSVDHRLDQFRLKELLEALEKLSLLLKVSDCIIKVKYERILEAVLVALCLPIIC